MRNTLITATFASAAMLLAAAAHGQQEDTVALGEEQAEKAREARQTVDEALDVVEKMKADQDLWALVQEARGIFIVPDYAKVAAGVGGQGGEGVVLLRQGEGAGAEWSPPAFYNVGGASLGAEIGVKVGEIAMLLMDEAAADMFMTEEDGWSLNADAGLTIVDYSAAAQESAREGDVVIWSDTAGAFAGASVGLSDIARDEEENEAFYSEPASARDILSGDITTDRAQELRDALTGTASSGAADTG